MNNKQLYDAISGIDTEFTDRVSGTLDSKEIKGKRTQIKPGIIVAIAVTALSITVVAAMLLILLPGKNTRQIRLLGDTDMAEIKYSGAKNTGEDKVGTPKEIAVTTGIYVEFIYPSQITNGGAFEFMLSMGLDKDYEGSFETPEGRIYDHRSPEVRIIMGYMYGEGEPISYNHYVSLIVTSDHTYNGHIFLNLGDYQKYAKNCQNEDFVFEGKKGILVEEIPVETGRELFLYKFGTDFTIDGPLPYRRIVSAEAVNLNEGDSGRISAAVHFTKGEGALMESRGQYLGHSVYYYCAGDVIGFGETLEEAQTNAASTENRNIIYIFDGYTYYNNEVDRLRVIEEEYKKRGITIVW